MSDKIKAYALHLLTTVWAFLAPAHTLIFATGTLVLLDLITGIAKAMKNGDKITSNRMRHTITKGLMYQLAILAAFMLDTVMDMGLMASRVVAGVIGIVECKSVLENVEAMTGANIWAAVLEKLKPPKTGETAKPEPPKTDGE